MVFSNKELVEAGDVYKNERLLRLTPRGAVDARARRRMLVPEDEFYYIELLKTPKRILDAGGQTQLGAHGQLRGWGRTRSCGCSSKAG